MFENEVGKETADREFDRHLPTRRFYHVIEPYMCLRSTKFGITKSNLHENEYVSQSRPVHRHRSFPQSHTAVRHYVQIAAVCTLFTCHFYRKSSPIHSRPDQTHFFGGILVDQG